MNAVLCSPGHCKTSLAKPVFHSSSLELKPPGHLGLFIFQSSPSGHIRAVSSCQKRSHFPEDMYLSHTYLRTADSETKELRHKPFQAEFVPRLKSLKRNLDVLDFPHAHEQTNSERCGRTPREVIVTYLCPLRIYYCYPEFHSGSLLTKNKWLRDLESLI